MSTFVGFLGLIFTFLSCFSLLLAGGVDQPTKLTKLYVEPFTTKSGPQELRTHVISELKKHSSLLLVNSASAAEATLDGGGEIWVKGYRSLNPRSGRLISDGAPLYDGYLAVELKDGKGQTFWSYLVTPGLGADNIQKDLARKIAKHVSEAMQQGEPAHYTVTPSKPSTTLTGAGATFPAPVYNRWFQNYRIENPNIAISYEAIGSEAGIGKLLDGKVDFGATDSPEAIRDLAPEQQNRFSLFPSVIGAVVPVVNLPGTPGDIALTPEVLANIYMGHIKKWNDPAIRQANRHMHLPDLDIVVVHRSDGSGTSYAWTDFLSKTNPVWKASVGTSLTPSWPTGKGAAGNEGVAELVKELGGAIGYVEYVYALRNHITFGLVRNQNGEFIGASLESMAIAAEEAVKMSADFKASIVNAPGAGAYPIASFTWLVVPNKISSGQKHQAIQDFLQWMLGPGQTQAAALGYLALPRDLLARETAAIQRLQ